MGEIQEGAYIFLRKCVPAAVLPHCQFGATELTVWNDAHFFGISNFRIAKAPSDEQLDSQEDEGPSDFYFGAPAVSINLLRVCRAMQLRKPVLLEGSPGVGNSTLIAALAKASGHNLVRINLSEQTDISDLFGSDLPAAGSEDDTRCAHMQSLHNRYGNCLVSRLTRILFFTLPVPNLVGQMGSFCVPSKTATGSYSMN